MEGFHAHYRVLSFPGYGYGADARIAYPYLTAEQFDRDCEQEAIDQARSVIDDQKAGR
jgi:hypothetical protein